MATITVTTANDVVNAGDGVLSLREAIAQAEGTAANDTIVFDASLDGETIRLQSTLNIIAGTGTAGSLTIDGDTDGDGDPNLTISGDTFGNGHDADDVTILYVNTNSNVTLTSVKLSGGVDYAADYAAYAVSAIENFGTLTIVDSILSDNYSAGAQGDIGGGNGGTAATVLNGGILSITNTIFENNVAAGGVGGPGQTLGTLNIALAGGRGGHAAAGIFNYSGSVALETVLFTYALANGGDGGFGGAGVLAGGNGGNGGSATGGVLVTGGTLSGNAGATSSAANAGTLGGGGFGGISNGSPGLNGQQNNLSLVLGGSGAFTDTSSQFSGASRGNDTITVDTGNDILHGMSGDDTFTAGFNIDTVFGGTGNDTVIVTADQFFDNVDGGEGSDTLDHSDQTYTFGRDTVDFAFGQMYFNSFFAGYTTTLANIEVFKDSNNGNDIIASNSGMTIFGNGGNDVIMGGQGLDTLLGGANGSGGDTVSFQNIAGAIGIVADMRITTVQSVGGDDISGFENIIGSNFADTIIASGNGGTIEGRDGDDLIILGGSIIGPAAPTIINGGNNTDTILFGGLGVYGTYTHNLTGTQITSIERLEFFDPGANNSHDVYLSAQQFGGGLASNLAVQFDSHSDTRETIHVALSPTSNILDLSALTFSGNIQTNNSFNIGGSTAADTITGSSIRDVINGDANNDSITGGGGADTLDGGAGSDTAKFLGASTEFNFADSNGLSFIVEDVIPAPNEGSDTLSNFEFVEFSDRTLNIIYGADNFIPDNIIGTALDNILVAGIGNDFLNGAAGGDVLLGGGGDDTLLGNAGADALRGGDNTAIVGQAQVGVGDTASYVTSDAFVVVNLLFDTAGNGHATGDTLDGIENLIGSAFGDSLVGDDTANYIDGFNDNDSLVGYGGDDYLNGGNGDDTLAGGEGADFLNGGSGLGDVADYFSSDFGVNAGVNAGAVNTGGHAAGDTLWVEDITGSTHNDNLIGNSVQNKLEGGDGDDFLNAGDNSDELFGGDGDDTLIGGRGADLIDGGDNTAVGDTASYVNAGARIVGSLLTNTVTFSGNGTGDTLVGIENITGSAFDDFIYGDNNANTLDGFGGNDFIVGNGGVDKLRGGAGIDTLDGGTGNDTLTGGSGNDTYDFNTFTFGQDTITDWQNGSDKLDFSNLNLDITDFTITQSGANTLLTYTFNPTQTVTLLAINMALIDAGDFVV